MLKAKLKAKMKADKKIALAYDARVAFQTAAINIIDDRSPGTMQRWVITGDIYDDLVMPLLKKARKKS